MMYLTVLSQVVAQYSNAEVVWVQEEPKNMGAWLYVKPRLDTAMRELFGEQVQLTHSQPTRIYKTSEFISFDEIIIELMQ